MQSPNDFLAATTGAGAGMVAIIGGLLVSRYLVMDSASQGSKLALKQIEDDLTKADNRVLELHRERRTAETRDIFDDHEVVKALYESESGLTLVELRALCPDAPDFDAEVGAVLRYMHKEVLQAKSQIHEAIHDHLLQLGDDADLDLPEWGPFLAHHLKQMDTEVPWLWEHVYDIAQIDLSEFEANPGTNAMLAHIAPFQGKPTWLYQTELSRLDELRRSVRTAEDARDDLKDRYYRAVETSLQMRRPDKLFLLGFAVLIYFAVVGVVLPLHALSSGPSEFTPHINTLFGWFVSGLTFLFIYMGFIVARVVKTNREIRYKRWPAGSSS